MPLTLRLGQCTLRGFGRCVEPTGAVDSSRRNPQGCMEIPMQLMPAILMEGPG